LNALKSFDNISAMAGKKMYKRKTSAKSAARTKTTFAKKVKSVLFREMESKLYTAQAANIDIITTQTSIPVYKNLTPILAQGITNSTRVGNLVDVTSAFITGRINIKPYNVTTNPTPPPVLVKMWLLSNKVNNTDVLSGAGINISSGFFDINSSALGMQGSVLDTLLTVNRDVFTVHSSKIIKLGTSSPGTAGNLPVLVTAYADNSPMSVPFYFSFGKYLRKLKYDDINTVCTNKNLFLVFQCISADGTTSSTNTLAMAEYHYALRINYKDA